jgi:DNA-binding SARP family transcriptional activator
MREIAILTFGRFTLCCEEQEIALPGRQGDTLCKALLCQPGRQAESGWLLEHLWPEAEGDLAITYLHNAAWTLRQTLPPGMLLTHKATQSYQLVGQQHLWIDADAALSLIAQAESLGRTTAEALPLLEQAVQYVQRGRFLAGVEETWVQARRIHIETMKERAFTWLVEAYRKQGKLPQAEALLSEAFAEDPTNENLLCHLMQTLHEDGMTHQALRAYDTFVKALKKAGLEPAEATTDLYECLKRAPRVLTLPHPSSLPVQHNEREPLPATLQEAEGRLAFVSEEMPAQQTEPLLLFPDRVSRIAWASHNHHRTLDVLSATPDSFFDGQDLGAWFALSAGDLAELFNVGWTTEGVLDVLRMTLRTIQDLPPVVRQWILQLSHVPLIRGTTFSTEGSLSSEDQTQLCISLGQSITQSWKLFHTSQPSLTLAIAQAQLALVKQIHALLYPATRPFFYAALYQLIGAALYLLGSFQQAQHALEQSYLTGLQAANAWHMAQSLSWQAYLWHARGEPDHAIDVLEQALRLISAREDPECLRLRARLFALEAEFLAHLGDASGAQERLHTAETFLASLREPHEEFDQVAWLQQAGICALYLHDYPLAIQRLERAFEQVPPPWRLRTIATAIPLAKALTRAKEASRTVEMIQKTLPLLTSLHAPVFTRQFVTYLEQEVPHHFPEDKRCHLLVIEARQQLETQWGSQ